MAAKAKKKSTVVSIPDLSEVEDGFSNLPEGTYHLKVKSAEFGESNAGNEMITWEFEVADGKNKGGTIREFTVLQANSLWKLKGLLAAMNFDIPDSAFDLDLADMVGEEVMGDVQHEEYDGKQRARLVDIYAVGAEEEEAEEEEKPSKPAKKGSKKEPEEDEEVEEKKPGKPAKKAAKPAKKKAATITEDEVMEMDEDALTELVSNEELEVDLDEHTSIRKKRNAVIEALEAADKLAAAE